MRIVMVKMHLSNMKEPRMLEVNYHFPLLCKMHFRGNEVNPTPRRPIEEVLSH